MDIINLNNVWSIKMNIEHSRREQLELKTQQEACRKQRLKITGRLAKWRKEKIKRQFKYYNKTFGKKKLKIINNIEYKK